MSILAKVSPDIAPENRSSINGSNQTLSHAIDGQLLTHDGLEYECSVVGFSLAEFEVRAAVKPPIKSAVVLYVKEIGLLVGVVTKRLALGGFIVKPHIGEERRARLEARMSWHAGLASEKSGQRAAERIVPTIQYTRVHLGERLVFKAKILNLSRTGALLVMNKTWHPLVGSVVIVGSRRSTVARLTETGFAVHFDVAITTWEFSQDIVL